MSDFWRELISAEFALKEVRINIPSGEVLTWQHKFFSRLISSPYRDRLAITTHRGRLLSAADLANFVEFSERIRRPILLKDVGSYISDRTFENHSNLFAGKIALASYFTNSFVDLQKPINFAYSTRKNLRRATDVFLLEIAVNQNLDADRIYQLHLKTRKRLGVPPYNKSFFHRLLDQVGQHIVCFSCFYQKKLIGFLLCYLHHDEMISGQLGYLSEFSHTKVTDFLFSNAFDWGTSRGYEIYRFGADYVDQSGLIHFKKRLGAHAYPQFDCMINFKNVPTSYAKNQLAQKILKITPDVAYPITQRLTGYYFW